MVCSFMAAAGCTNEALSDSPWNSSTRMPHFTCVTWRRPSSFYASAGFVVSPENDHLCCVLWTRNVKSGQCRNAKFVSHLLKES